MSKTVAAGLTALFVTASSLAYAQAPSATTTTGCYSTCKIDPLNRGIGVQN
jgi:hypothetical protein